MCFASLHVTLGPPALQRSTLGAARSAQHARRSTLGAARSAQQPAAPEVFTQNKAKNMQMSCVLPACVSRLDLR